MMTGDELYRRMFTAEDTTTHTMPTKAELWDALRGWAAWSQEYGPLIGTNDMFIEMCDRTVDLISRQELRHTRVPPSDLT